MLQIPNIETPFTWALNHLQLVGWPVVVMTAFKVARAFAKLQVAVESGEQKFTEMHKAITNDFSHLLPDMVELMKIHNEKMDDIAAVQIEKMDEVAKNLVIHDVHETEHHAAQVQMFNMRRGIYNKEQ